MNPTIIVHRSEIVAFQSEDVNVLLQARFLASFGLDFHLADFEDESLFNRYVTKDTTAFMVEYLGDTDGFMAVTSARIN